MISIFSPNLGRIWFARGMRCCEGRPVRSDSSDRRRAMNVRHNKTLIFTLTVDGDEGKEKRVLKRV